MKETQKIELELKPLSRGSENINLSLSKQEQHLHTHHTSLSPLSADDIESIHNLNPNYVERILSIVEKNIETENIETKSFYNAIENEQKINEMKMNGELKLVLRGQIFALFAIIFLPIIAFVFAYNGNFYIAGILASSVLMLAIKYFIGKKDTKKKNPKGTESQ